MIIALITVIISFFLESIVSNFIGIDSKILVPLFTLISLIIIYPYFKSNNSAYLKACILIGLFYDFVYTDTLILNAMAFLTIGYFITKYNYLFSTNIPNLCIMIPLAIIIYRIFVYSILCLSEFISFSWDNLFLSIYSSLVINIIYGILIYLITNYFAKKYQIKKID